MRKPDTLVRTTVMLDPDTNRALREMAKKGNRPLSWEIREALEAHVANGKKR